MRVLSPPSLPPSERVDRVDSRPDSSGGNDCRGYSSFPSVHLADENLVEIMLRADIANRLSALFVDVLHLPAIERKQLRHLTSGQQ